MSAKAVLLDMEQVAGWYESGLSLRDIAARTGVGSKTVQRHMVKAGIPRREPSCNMPPAGYVAVAPEEIKAIRSAVAGGGSVEAVARQFRRSETVVRKVARDLLVKPDREAEREQVRALHEEGLSTSEIARKLGWGRTKVLDAKKALGLPARRQIDSARACSLYRDLGTLRAVAATLRIGEARVSAILREAGVEVCRGGKRKAHRLDAHLPQLRHSYLVERVPLGELAERYECKPSTLSFYLISRGVPPRTRRLTAAEHDQVLEMRASGMNMVEIGRHFGITGQSVRWHLGHRPQRVRQAS